MCAAKNLFLSLAASVLLPASAMAQRLPTARYSSKDNDTIIYEKGIAENQKQFGQRGVPLLGLIDVEVFKLQVPRNQLGKAKHIIDNAIKKATTQPIMMNVGYSEDQQHMGDIDMGNGIRSGIFIGGIDGKYKAVNILKSDTAFLKLPAIVDQNDTDSVIIPDDTKEYLSGFKFKIKMDSSKTDKEKAVSYDVEVKTKVDSKNDIWEKNTYNLTLKPGEQRFFYTLPKADKNSKELADVYVFALYPYVRTDYYDN